MPFRDVIGHRRIVALLARSIERDALPPSLVFTGAAGAGKRLTALAVAQALNCLAPIPASASSSGNVELTRDACGTCPSCVRIARGAHPDVLIVEPGENGSIRVDQIRDVVDRAAYRPFEGRRRVAIVDVADEMVSAAQNALLKTLEEPPPSSVFILLTSRLDALLPTVRSRCIRLAFAEGATGMADADARTVARKVLAHAVATPEPRRRIEGAKELLVNTGGGGASDRSQLASHLMALGELLRDVEILGVRGDAARLAGPADEGLAPLAAAYRGERGVRAYAAVDRALHALESNAGVKTVADWVMLEL